MNRLELALFGPVQVTIDGEPRVDSLWAKTLALLAYLAVESDRPHRRDALAGLLWPEQPNTAARNNLRQALHQLRRALGEGPPAFLLVTPQTVQLNQASNGTLDVAEFSALIEASEGHNHRRPETCSACVGRLERAVALYRGDLLAGFFLEDSVAFEEWALVRRERLRRAALWALHVLATHSERKGDYGHMERAARRQVELDSFQEGAHRQVMRALAWAGRHNAALAHYAELSELLQRELGADPEGQTVALYHQIRAGTLSPPALPLLGNWPTPLTPLIDRQAEVTALAEQLQAPDARLVTVVGAAGIGKTRLALEVAAQEACAYEDGARFVPLATVFDPEYIVPAIAAALELTFAGSADPQSQLSAHLRGQDLLLVLDNYEHLLEGAPLVTELLGRCPRLQILVTSREPLHVRGERQVALSPLEVPDIARLPAGDAAVATLAEVPAVVLFTTRARAVQPGFTLNADNAAAVAEICVHLDGLPLAIELAAARTALFTPEQMLPRLSDRLALLVDGARDLPPRQRTLRATLDWSHSLLSEDERRLFARLSVFAEGCTREAAEAVCGGERSGQGMADEAAQTIETDLQSLLNKGLVQRQEVPGDAPRFAMLETVREYAWERLAHRGEQAAQRSRHAAYFVGLAEQAGSKLTGPEQQTWLKRLMRDQGNVRLALRWAMEQEELESALRLSAALRWFWYTLGYFDEGRRWGEAALALPGGPPGEAPVDLEPALLRAHVMEGTGVLAGCQGDYARAVAWLEQALSLIRPAGDQARTASALAWLGWAAYEHGDYERSRGSYEESLAIARERGAAGRGTAAFVLNGLGEMARHQGDYAAARAYYEESLALRQEMGDPHGVMCTLLNLGQVAHGQGKNAEARQLFHESLSLARDIHSQAHIAGSMACLAAVAQATGQAERAAQLIGQADALLLAIGAALDAVDQAAYEHTVAATRAELDEAAFAATKAQGQARSLEEAIAYAMRDN